MAEIKNDLGKCSNEAMHLFNKIFLKLTNKHYYRMKGEMEGKIAEIKNHISITEIRGVSLGARNDRYEVRLVH